MLTIRHIQTKTVPLVKDGAPVVVDGAAVTQIVPDLDADGNEIEVWSVDVPAEIEAEGGAAIDAYVAAQLATPASPPIAVTATTEDPDHG